MSYPSQPAYTPPYGQPQPPRQTNLWMVGGAVVVILAIIMTVTLLIIQRTAGGNQAGGGGQDPTTEATSKAEEEPTAEEDTGGTDDDTDSGGDSGGDGEPAGFEEATCDAFDLAGMEELYGSTYDPDQDYTYASSGGGTGSIRCSWYTEDWDSVTVDVASYDSADYAMEWWEGDRDYWEEADDYEVTDFTELGDAGYHVVFGDEQSGYRGIEFVSGALIIEVQAWIYPSKHDLDATDAFVVAMGQQALDMFGEYA